MKTLGRVLVFCLVLGALRLPSAGANSMFGYTHIQPSPLTLSAGRLVFGTDVAYGVTDFFQIGTNVVRDVYQFFNANAKVSLIELDEFALSPTFSFETYNLKNISELNPDLRVTSFMPGLTTAYGLAEDLALFVAGNLNITKTTLVTEGITTSGLIRGAQIGSDLSWAYNPPAAKKGKDGKEVRRGVGNVFSTGVSYDLTYKLFGVGLSHHWPGFHLGVHYYPNATKFPIQPIIAGGGAVDL
ncbi:MAG: hypothetical protein AB1540_08550 [Bdellovibrionota bacterium]